MGNEPFALLTLVDLCWLMPTCFEAFMCNMQENALCHCRISSQKPKAVLQAKTSARTCGTNTYKNCQPDGMCCTCCCQRGRKFQAMIPHTWCKAIAIHENLPNSSNYPPNLGTSHLRQQIFCSFPVCSSAREGQCCVGHWCHHWGHWGLRALNSSDFYDPSTSRILS